MKIYLLTIICDFQGTFGLLTFLSLYVSVFAGVMMCQSMNEIWYITWYVIIIEVYNYILIMLYGYNKVKVQLHFHFFFFPKKETYQS